jgi:hypothetical protein
MWGTTRHGAGGGRNRPIFSAEARYEGGVERWWAAWARDWEVAQGGGALPALRLSS